MSASIHPYLSFAGRCEEALEFYAEKLDAKIAMKMRYCDSPVPLPPGRLPPGFEKKIMHASFFMCGSRFMASDSCDDQGTFSGFRLVLTVPTVADSHQVFDGLADGGTVEMPIAETFFSRGYGIVRDRFQVGWIVMVQGEHGTSDDDRREMNRR
jgi:PhnB protein